MDIEQRLAKLERSNRRLRLGALGLALILVAAATVAMTEGEDNEFIVRDAGNRIRARLGMEEGGGGPGLWFFDAAGKKRLGVKLDGGDNPIAQFYGKTGEPAFFLDAAGTGKGGAVGGRALPQNVCVSRERTGLYHRCPAPGELRCPDIEGFPRIIPLSEAIDKEHLQPCPKCFPDQ